MSQMQIQSTFNVMASVSLYQGSGGRAPQRGPKAGVRGQSPPEAESTLSFRSGN